MPRHIPRARHWPSAFPEGDPHERVLTKAPTDLPTVVAGQSPPLLAEALARMTEAEETLRAIGAGEVDAFVVSDEAGGQRVFTLSTADRPYRVFVENMRDGAATLSLAGTVLYANRRLGELLSCSRESIVGWPLARFLARGEAIDLGEIRGPLGLGATIELDLIDAEGGFVTVLVGSSPLDGDGLGLTCLTFTDLSAQKAQDRVIAGLSQDQAERISDLRSAQDALTAQATHDGLTGLPNRALLMEGMEQALVRAKGTRQRCVVAFVDLDGFKSINDVRGRLAGDEVLKLATSRLASCLGPSDVIARVGTDEFVVLALGIDSHLNAVDLGARLASALSKSDGPLSGSVGIAISIGGRGKAEILIKEAETAMHHAKSLGGGRAAVYDAAWGRRLAQGDAAQRMVQAAVDDRLVVVHYQPIVDLPTGIVSGFEALARISQRNGSTLEPADFIAVAEGSGLIIPLGEQVLRLASLAASQWQRVDALPLTVAVNVSARQFWPGNLRDLVRESLDESGLTPDCLSLELTETAIFDLSSDILSQLNKIRDLGVEIGLDDFGTGYASLTHLRRLPLSFVKIDQSFVRQVLTDRGDERIVAAVVDLAANLGLRSIAEGVETAEQLLRLRELGCNQAQGYLFARPIPEGDVPTVLAHSAW